MWRDISHYKHQWMQEAWQLDHPWLHKWEGIKWAVRKIVQPIAHRIALRVLEWGYVNGVEDKDLVIHAQRIEIQRLQNELHHTKIRWAIESCKAGFLK